MTKSTHFTATNLWPTLCDEAEKSVKKEPILTAYMRSHILDHKNFSSALAYVLATKLADENPKHGLGVEVLSKIFLDCYSNNPDLVRIAMKDLLVIPRRDPAVKDIQTPFLNFKGYQALQAYRLMNYLWHKDRKDMAKLLQGQASIRFQVDIHPAAQLGQGIMIDHATGVVIGETAVIEDDVSILHGVTLGGTGKQDGVRHPHIGNGVLLGANATILGNIEIGEGSRIAAGSVVLVSIPAHVTVAGVPGRVVGKAGVAKPAEVMDQVPEALIGRAHRSKILDDFQI